MRTLGWFFNQHLATLFASFKLLAQHAAPGLPGWPFWGQISEIWSQITLAGPKKFVWPFGSFLGYTGPLQELDLTTLGPVCETIFSTI